MRDDPRDRARSPNAYAIALAAVALAVLVRWLLFPLLQDQLPFITLYAAVAVAVWFGGWRPAVLASALGFVAIHLLFAAAGQPSMRTMTGATGWTAPVAYVISCLVIVVLGDGMARARRRAEALATEALERERRLASEIAERAQAEGTLRAREAELALLSSQTPLLLIRCTADRRFSFVNRACADFLGRSPEELVGRPIDDVLGAEGRAVTNLAIDRVLRGETVEMEREVDHPELGRRYLHVTYTPDRDALSRVVGWIATALDVTVRKRAELAAHESQARSEAEAEALARLNELSARLWRTESESEGLEEMLGATIELLGADKGHLQVRDPERNVLVLAAQRGFEPPFLDLFREITTQEDSACARTLRSGERQIVEDVEEDEAFADRLAILRDAGIRAIQSTPLVASDGGLLGVLSTHFGAVHRPSAQDLRRLDLYLRQAVGFIERCRSEEALRAADRQKDAFIATLAHELRNPLAPIRSAVQIFQLRDLADPDLRWALGVVDRQVGRMTHLIDDLMDVSRITRNRLELKRARITLAEVVQQAVETSRPVIDARGQTLSVELPSEDVILDGDAIRLAQVFSNLLDNAAKYSEAGSAIALEAARRGESAIVVVRDEGVGIAKEMLPRVFEMFTQIDGPLHRSAGGLGIGLSLVKRLVEMHGGSVEASSDGPGAGSRFTVRLPVAAERAEGAGDVPARSLERPAERAADPRIDAKAVGRRILVVDDNVDAAATLALMMEMRGFEVRVVHDGPAALAEMARFRPDGVVLDIGMPGMNGYEVARRIRMDPESAGVLLVALTGWSQAEFRERALEAGFDHHLVKPVDAGTLMALLST